MEIVFVEISETVIVAASFDGIERSYVGEGVISLPEDKCSNHIRGED